MFEKFKNVENIVNEITNDGLKINAHFNTKNENLPIDFLLYFGNFEIAQTAFNNYLNEQKLKRNAKSCYKNYEENENIPYRFITDITMKKAFLNALEIL